MEKLARKASSREAKSLESELSVVEGMQFDRGYISPYFITDANKMVAELEDATSRYTRRNWLRCNRYCRC
jgi:hypothetical protein